MDLQGQQPYRDCLPSSLLSKHNKLLLILFWLGPDWYRYLRNQARANLEGINKLLLDYEQPAQTSWTPTPVGIVSCPSTHIHSLLRHSLCPANWRRNADDMLAIPKEGKLRRDDTEGQGDGQDSPGQTFEQRTCTRTEVRDGQRCGSTLLHRLFLLVWLGAQGLGLRQGLPNSEDCWPLTSHFFFHLFPTLQPKWPYLNEGWICHSSS